MNIISGIRDGVFKVVSGGVNTIGDLARRIASFVYSWFRGGAVALSHDPTGSNRLPRSAELQRSTSSGVLQLARRIIGQNATVSNEQSLEDRLQLWVNAGWWPVGKDVARAREEAKNRILKCHQNNGTALDLGGLSLTDLPPEIGLLSNLQKLTLVCNQLRTLPASIGSLSNLQELYLCSNQLRTLPASIGSLSNLQELNLCSNQLRTLPASIGSLSNLKGLYLGHNKLTAFPSSPVSLNNLQNLDLSFNKLTTLPDSIVSLSNLQKLDLAGTQLRTLPSSIGFLRNLQMLDLSSNKLTALPSSIVSLSNLQALYLFRNKLTTFPSSLVSLNNLQNLDLSFNKLTTLPDSIVSLSNLQKLCLSDNQLTSLAAEIGSLRNLQRLDFYNNSSLRELPITLGNLAGITELDISGTQILPATRGAILTACMSLRNAVAVTDFERTLQLWNQYAGNTSNLEWIDTLTTELLEDEKKAIYEWLTRLSKSRDFRNNQRSLSKIVCAILQSVLEPSFRDLFFSQVNSNNERCQDRAAMALNELYVSWRLLCSEKDSSLADKLKVIVGAGKTLALRSLLSKAITDRQKSTNTTLEESVEIYLYFETSLKKELGLLTAIETMSYDGLGNVGWIQKEALKNRVLETYVDFAVDLPAFDAILGENATISSIRDKYAKDLENLGDCPEADAHSEAVLNWTAGVGKCNADCEKAIKAFKKTWLSEKLTQRVSTM